MSNIFYPEFNSIKKYDTFSVFPESANHGDFAVALDTNILYEFNGLIWIAVATPGGSAVDSVTGWNVDNTDPANPIINDLVTDVTLTGAGTLDSPLSVVGTNDDLFDAKVATTTVLPGTPTYANGSSGVGRTLTRVGGSLGNIDGYTPVVSDRILVKNQAAALQNGIYEVTSLAGGYVLTGATDSDQTAEFDDQIVAVNTGADNAGTVWGQQTPFPVIGTDSIVYSLSNIGGVKQQNTGSQILGQIPWWVTANKTLAKGNSDFTFINTTKTFTIKDSGNTTFLVDPANQIYKLGAPTGFGNAGTHIDIDDGNNLFGFYIGSFGADPGLVMQMGLAGTTYLPYGAASGQTHFLRFLELAANGGDGIGWKGPNARTSNTTLDLVMPPDDPTAGQVMAFSVPSSGVSTGSWMTPLSSGTAWLLDGNTVGSEKYIGTDDNFRLPIRVNNVETFSLETDGSIKRYGGLYSVSGNTTTTTWGALAGAASNNADTSSVFIGYGAGVSCSASAAVIINGDTNNFSFASTYGNSTVAIGNAALASSTAGFNTAIGVAAGQFTTTGTGNVYLGYNADANPTFGNATGSNNFVFGQYGFVGGNFECVFSAQGLPNASNQIVFGGGNAAAFYSAGYFGNGVVNSTAQNFVFNGTGGSGTNKAGANVTIAGGKATGDAAGGTVFISTSLVGSTGTTLQTLSNVVGFEPSGNIRAFRLHNNATAQGNASNQDIRSGTYTPTLTSVTNVSSTTAYKSQWLRVGNTVTVSGKMDVTPTTISLLTQVGISLPVASNLAANQDACGSGSSSGIGISGAILGDATNDRAELDFTVGAVITSQPWYYQFTYEVI